MHPPSPLTLCEGGRFLAALGMTVVGALNWRRGFPLVFVFWLPLVQGGGAWVVLLPMKWIATLRAGSQSIRRCRFVRDVELLLAFLVRSLPALPDRGPGSRLVG